MKKLLLMAYDASFVYIIKNELEYMIGKYKVMVATNKQEGINLWEKENPDIIVCDTEILGENAYSMPMKIRQKDENVLIFFISFNFSSKDIISGYNAGVNGYLKKPFIPEELNAHIQALLRLKDGKSAKSKVDSMKIGDYALDVEHCVLSHKIKENNISLTNKEAQILEMLCLEKGNIVKRDEILKKVWYTRDDSDFYASRSLDVLLARLRKKMKLKTGTQIKTTRGVGISLE